MTTWHLKQRQHCSPPTQNKTKHPPKRRPEPAPATDQTTSTSTSNSSDLPNASMTTTDIAIQAL